MGMKPQTTTVSTSQIDMGEMMEMMITMMMIMMMMKMMSGMMSNINV